MSLTIKFSGPNGYRGIKELKMAPGYSPTVLGEAQQILKDLQAGYEARTKELTERFFTSLVPTHPDDSPTPEPETPVADTPPAKKRTRKTPTKRKVVPAATVRAWGEARGLIEAGKRGRLPQSVIEAYNARGKG